jgi:flagellar protein FliO/FliZ
MSRLSLLLAFLPLAASAADPAAIGAAPASPPGNAAAALPGGVSMAGQFGHMLLGLALVIGLIFLLGWVLRRVQQIGPRGGQVIKLVASQALGPRDRLLLVQVGAEQILLGVSPGRITTLHVLEEPVHLGDAEAASPEFAQRLMELLGKDQKDKT